MLSPSSMSSPLFQARATFLAELDLGSDGGGGGDTTTADSATASAGSLSRWLDECSATMVVTALSVIAARLLDPTRCVTFVTVPALASTSVTHDAAVALLHDLGVPHVVELATDAAVPNRPDTATSAGAAVLPQAAVPLSSAVPAMDAPSPSLSPSRGDDAETPHRPSHGAVSAARALAGDASVVSLPGVVAVQGGMNGGGSGGRRRSGVGAAVGTSSDLRSSELRVVDKPYRRGNDDTEEPPDTQWTGPLVVVVAVASVCAFALSWMFFRRRRRH